MYEYKRGFTMNRKQLALVMLVISVGMGLLGSIFFYENGLGINMPIYVAIATGVILLTARLSRERINRRNLWVILPMLFFALMVAVRASPLMITLNIIAVITLGTLFIRYLRSQQAIDTASLSNHIFTPLDVGLYTIYAPLMEAGHSLKFVRERNWKDAGNLGAVLRGLLFAIPILLIFGILLSSADAVFANSFDGFFDWLFSTNMVDVIDPLFVAGIMGWLMLSALSYALARRIPELEGVSDEDNPQLKKQRPSFRIGMIESSMVLGSVALLFGFFVLIQFTYLFGGQSNIAETLNYSQYARRGFFELVAVAVLVLGMILYFDHITLRRNTRQSMVFRLLSIVIVGLTMIMLVSAWRRMALYELAYGFTYLRVLTHVFMFWLGVLLVFAILNVMRVRTNIFALGVLLSCIGYIATLDVMNVDTYIAERNIQAYLDNESERELDICYLRELSIDAYIPMWHFYHSTALRDSDTQQLHDHMGWWLYNRVNESLERTHSGHVAYIFPLIWEGDSLTIPSELALDEDLQYTCHGRYGF
jgi:hypothetical protein